MVARESARVVCELCQTLRSSVAREASGSGVRRLRFGPHDGLRAVASLRSCHVLPRRRRRRPAGGRAGGRFHRGGSARVRREERERPRTASRAVDGRLLGRHRRLPHPRALSRDPRSALLRGRGLDQRVHGRLPGAEPRPLPRRGRCALVRVRARLQRAPGEGRPCARLARRLDAALARAARPRRGDRSLRPRRAVGHAPLRLRGGAAGARRRPLARPLPDRRPARADGRSSAS